MSDKILFNSNRLDVSSTGSDRREQGTTKTIMGIFGVLLITRSSADADKPARRVYSQSRSPNIVPFHTLGIVSSCAIATLSFPIFDFRKCCDLEIRVIGHSRSLKVVPFDRLRMISY